MKKLLLLLLFFSNLVCAQTFPVQNLSVLGTSNFAGNLTANAAATFNGTNSFTGATSFTVSPTAPTAPYGSNTQQLANTNFVVSHTVCPSIMDFGGNNNGTLDNTAALSAAISASPAGTGKVCVSFPAGTFAFNAAVAVTIAANSSLMLQGSGADVTYFTFPNVSSGLTLNLTNQFSSYHVHDLSIVTGQIGVGTAALSIVQTSTSVPDPAITPMSEIQNVSIHGADGYANNFYWSYGISVLNASQILFHNLTVAGNAAIGGIGVLLNSSAADPGVEYNFAASNFVHLNQGISIANYIQGVTVSQSNFTANIYGIEVQPGVNGLDQLTVVASQFACKYGISADFQMQNTMIMGNLFIVQNLAGNYGIHLAQAVLYTIVGNTFQNANSPPSTSNNPIGIYIANTSNRGGIITGNLIRYMGTGIFLDTTATFNNIQSNLYFDTPVPITNNGSNNTLGGGST